MGGALDIPGPDLSPGRDEPGLRSVGPFPPPGACGASPFPLASSPRDQVPAVHHAVEGGMEEPTRGKWMKTANYRQPARRLTTGISRDPATGPDKGSLVVVVVGVVVDIVFDGRRIKLWASRAHTRLSF